MYKGGVSGKQEEERMANGKYCQFADPPTVVLVVWGVLVGHVSTVYFTVGPSFSSVAIIKQPDKKQRK